MDHPHVMAGELTALKKIFYRQHAVNRMLEKYSNRVGCTISALKRQTPNLNHSIIVRPSFRKNEATSRVALKTIIQGGNVLNLITKFFHGRTFMQSLILLACEKLGIGVYTNRFLISLQLEQRQNNKGCVIITDDIDEFGRMIPKVIRYFGDELMSSLEHMKKLMRQLCRNGSNFTGYDVGTDEFLSGSHHSGTCRLGLSKEDSVIDVNLKYYNLHNLYVCDASVFPKIGNVNLSVTIALFAVRLASRLQYLREKNVDHL